MFLFVPLGSITMAVTKDKGSKRGDKKPKHGMDKNRPNKDTGNMRSAATVRLLGDQPGVEPAARSLYFALVMCNTHRDRL